MSLLFATRLFHEFHMLKKNKPIFNSEQYRHRQTSITWNMRDNQTFYYDEDKVSISPTQQTSHQHYFVHLEPESESEDDTK
jgi:hypothetical protein